MKQHKQNKFSTPYNPKPFLVQETKGSMITASNGSDTVTRNSSHFKVVPKQLLQDHSGKNDVENPTSVAKEDILQRRSQRQIKPPVRFRRTLLLFLRIENVDQSEADLQRLFDVSYFRYFFQSSSQEEEECNVVNHEFITSRDLSKSTELFGTNKQGVVFLFTRSIVQKRTFQKSPRCCCGIIFLFASRARGETSPYCLAERNQKAPEL